MTKQNHIDLLCKALIELRSTPLYDFRIQNSYFPVIGEGSLDTKILIVGEAPGKNEAESGKPFCGKSGKILDDVLLQAGLDRQQIYITNIVKDRPPENRDPSSAEIEAYAPFLDRQIEIIKPEVLITLGRISMGYILHRYCGIDHAPTISQVHGQTFSAQTKDGYHFTVIPMFHPAATIYNKESRSALYTDMKKVVSLVV